MTKLLENRVVNPHNPKLTASFYRATLNDDFCLKISDSETSQVLLDKGYVSRSGRKKALERFITKFAENQRAEQLTKKNEVIFSILKTANSVAALHLIADRTHTLISNHGFSMCNSPDVNWKNICCMEQNDSMQYICTLPNGHGGTHEAQDHRGEIVFKFEKETKWHVKK